MKTLAQSTIALLILLTGLHIGVSAQAVSPAALTLEPMLINLASPLFLTNAHDGSNRLFVVEQPGRVLVLRPNTTTPLVFLNITAKVLAGGERGLLGLTFHPQFSTNRRFFVNYTRQPDGATVIAEYRAAATNPDAADPEEKVLLVIPQPYENHNGGMIEFGPDGFLYIGMGDGGSANDPENRAQNIEELLGKMLRIDVDHAGATVPYTSPSDNPFFGSTPGRDEIYATGLRNPFRFSFDRATGQLYVGDVGQGVREEIDVVTRGGNYGWRVFEGTRCTGLGPAACVAANYQAPVAEYNHVAGRCSITGGYVYRGTRATLPVGTYVYGDFCTGEIFLLQGTTQSLLQDTTLSISSFGEDETGELYVVGLGGTVHRLVNTCSYSVSPATQNFPAGGGQGSINITTTAGCPWTASSLVSWITITSGSGTGSGTITFTVAPNTGPARTGQLLYTNDSFYTITQAAAATSVQFSVGAYSAGEGEARATVTVTRTGDASGATTVNYQTVDSTADVGCADTTSLPGTAFARCDYATTIDTLTFAAGETSKTISVPLIDDGYVEPSETFQLVLSNPSSGAALGASATATVTITDNDVATTPNPIFTSAFFVRQHYLDFLSREPDPAGFNAWLGVLNRCPDVNNVDPSSSSAPCDRITVSASFFGSQEFQLKGLFVYRFYRVAFGRLPEYAEIVLDMRAVTGQTADEVFAKKAQFANAFTQRTEFTGRYNSQPDSAYVTTLLGRYQLNEITTPDPQQPDGTQKVTLTSTALINRLNGTQLPTMTRAQVLRAIADSDQVAVAEFNRAFVLMQYVGYLRRTPDQAGYNAWLNYLNTHPTDFRTMVNGFMNSTEYRLRFGSSSQ